MISINQLSARGFSTLSSKNEMQNILSQQKSNILRATSSTKRLSKPKIKELNKNTINMFCNQKLLLTQVEPYAFETASFDSIEKLLRMILQKGKKIPEYLVMHQLKQASFIDKHFKQSKLISMQLKNKVQKLMKEGRINSQLKGINRSVMEQIENCLMTSLDKERELYQHDMSYKKNKEVLKSKLCEYKQDLGRQLRELRGF